MGGVDGRGAGGGSRDLLPRTRLRLDVKFRARGSRPLRLPQSSACLNGGDSSVGSPTLYCFPVIYFVYCGFSASFLHLFKLCVLFSNWSYWASDLLLLCHRCTCQSHPSKARGLDPRALNGPKRNRQYSFSLLGGQPFKTWGTECMF